MSGQRQIDDHMRRFLLALSAVPTVHAVRLCCRLFFRCTSVSWISFSSLIATAQKQTKPGHHHQQHNPAAVFPSKICLFRSMPSLSLIYLSSSRLPARVCEEVLLVSGKAVMRFGVAITSARIVATNLVLLMAMTVGHATQFLESLT
jgi:hypothetical protein